MNKSLENMLPLSIASAPSKKVKDLAGKVVLLIGSHAAALRPTAVQLARRGAHVGLLCRPNGESLQPIKEMVEANGGRFYFLNAADPTLTPEEMIHRLRQTLGGIDAFINLTQPDNSVSPANHSQWHLTKALLQDRDAHKNEN